MSDHRDDLCPEPGDTVTLNLHCAFCGAGYKWTGKLRDKPLGGGLCPEHQKASDAPKLQTTAELLNPSGTKLERLTRLVECAKALGFKAAHEAWWDVDNAEYPMENYADVVDGNCGTYEVRIGLFLDDSIWVESHYDEDIDDYPVTVMDEKPPKRKLDAPKEGQS